MWLNKIFVIFYKISHPRKYAIMCQNGVASSLHNWVDSGSIAVHYGLPKWIWINQYHLFLNSLSKWIWINQYHLFLNSLSKWIWINQYHLFLNSLSKWIWINQYHLFLNRLTHISHTCDSFVTRNWFIVQSDSPSVMHCLWPELAYLKHGNTKEIHFQGIVVSDNVFVYIWCSLDHE